MMVDNIDFLNPQRGQRLGWCVLALGALAAASAGYVNYLARQAHGQVVALQEAAQASAKLRPVDTVESPAETARRQRVAQVRALRERSWMRALRGLELAAVPPTYLLQVSINAETGELRVEAEAPGLTEATAFTSALNSGPGWEQALLLAHEPAADPNVAGLRFKAVARWRRQ